MHQINKETDLRLVDLFFFRSLVLFHTTFVFLLHMPVPMPACIIGKTEEEKRIDTICPCSQPPWRRDYNQQGSSLVIPFMIVVRTPYLKLILARRQIGIRSRILFGVNNPLFIYSFQAVRITVFQRIFVTQGYKAHRESIMFVR